MRQQPGCKLDAVVEEIILWKKGWKYTAVWMAAYAFLCTFPIQYCLNCTNIWSGYFPRMILLVPHAILLGVLVANHPSLRGKISLDDPVTKTQPVPPVLPKEGSVDWLANLQAIQNLMGAV